MCCRRCRRHLLTPRDLGRVRTRGARLLGSPDRGGDGISVEHVLLTERLVQVLRDAGLSLNAGTVNHPQLLNRVLEFSPDAIGTDRPHELRTAFEAVSAPALSGY